MLRYLLPGALCFVLCLPAIGAKPRAATAGDFDSIMADWKQSLARLRALHERHVEASGPEKATIEAQFNAELAAARKLAPRLMAAAEAAYRTDPKAHPALSELLLENVTDNIRQGNFAEAQRVAQLLLDGGYTQNKIHYLAGIAAFGANNNAAAVKVLQAGAKAGTLEAEGQHYLREAQTRAAEAEADDLPRVKLTISKGDIVLELFENEAPKTTANFISLVQSGFYNGLTFHRVIPGFMAQGGDPAGDGSGGPDYTIPCECYQANHRDHFPGSLSMAHAGRDTGGSQFFITFSATASLNGKHTVFGRVIDGFDVLKKIQPTEGEFAGPPEKIEKAVVLRKRDHGYEPTKIPKTKSARQ